MTSSATTQKASCGRIAGFLLFLLFFAGPATAGTPVELARTVPGTVASQSHSHGSGLYPAQNALDDDPTTFNHTDSGGVGAAWELTFPTEQEIGQVELITRNCCGGRLNGATLRLFDNSDTMIYETNVVDSGPLTSFATPQLTGVFAKRLRIGFEPGQAGIVHMAEVYVFAPEGDPPSVTSFASDLNAISSGQSALLSWTTADTTSASIDGVGSVPINGSISVNPTVSTVYYFTAENDCGSIVASTSIKVDDVPLLPRITEFMAYPDDWIEIFNPANDPLDLTGWHLTDDPLDPNRWTFPVGETIPPGGFLLVDEPFKLARENGSYLALTDPSGTVVSEFTYPWQSEKGTYGTDFDDNSLFFLEPSPGTFNGGVTTLGFLPGATFSTERGFFSTPFSLNLAPQTPGASVLFSLDGSDPATPYTGAIPINRTTVVRAIETLADHEPSRSIAHTYVFVADVVTQPILPDGFPAKWIPDSNNGSGLGAVPARSDYEMDPDIVNAGPFTDGIGSSYEVADALLDIPSICLTLPTEELLDEDDGLHANALLRGRAWERDVSMEILDPSAANHHHVGAGLRIHGGRGRVGEMLKKSFRLYFRGDYGATKLDYPLFDGMPKGGFDHLVLRGGNGKTYASPWRTPETLSRVTYLRDQFLRDTHRDMEQPSFAGNFVHLYINGIYWGLYNPVERPGGPYAANHFGGDGDEDWDFLKWANGLTAQVVSGDTTAWDEVLALGNADPVGNYHAIAERVEIDNLADFMIANAYVGNRDWTATGNNGYCFRSRTDRGGDVANGKFHFMCWDGEESLSNPGDNYGGSGRNDNTAVDLHRDLRAGLEYRLRFADRLHQHIVDEDGVLKPGPSSARHHSLASLIDRSMSAESARWGDLIFPEARTGQYPGPKRTFTRTDWLTEITNLDTNFLTVRDTNSFGHLKNEGLYPDTVAPVAQLTPGNLLNISAPAGTIYYTTDGSDPRLPGGTVSSKAMVFSGGSESNLIPFGGSWNYLDNGSDLSSSTWTQSSYDDTSWPSNDAPFGYGNVTGMTFNTPISFGPDSNNKHITTYFRRDFTIVDKDALGQIQLRYLVDDALAIYLNGVEFIRPNLPNTPLTANTPALASTSEGVIQTHVIPLSFLQNGVNTIAVEVHQRSADTSDMGFDLSISGASGGLPLSGDILVNTRAFNASEWSALESEAFIFGSPAEDLVISEFMYHPAPVTSAEIAAGFDDDDYFEYIEIRNISDIDIVLDGLRFSKGVDVDLVGTLQPGKSAMVVANIIAFQMRYGTGHQIIAQWETGDKLDNGGELVRLRGRDNGVLIEFDYDDVPNWPVDADGMGYSLVLVDPFSQPDHNDPLSWRVSSATGGNPGSSDSTTFTGENDAALLEYATAGIRPSTRALADGSIELSIHLNRHADDLTGWWEISENLTDWEPAGSLLSRVSVDETTDPFAAVTYGFSPSSTEKALFFRYRVDLR